MRAPLERERRKQLELRRVGAHSTSARSRSPAVFPAAAARAPHGRGRGQGEMSEAAGQPTPSQLIGELWNEWRDAGLLPCPDDGVREDAESERAFWEAAEKRLAAHGLSESEPSGARSGKRPT